MAVQRKYERDIDLLLAEEFAVNPEFADWFRARTKLAGPTAGVADVFVSKATNLGESDLIVIYQTTEGERSALLIEDKIDAPIQPDQANRYRLRAEKEVGIGNFAHYEVILCAPQYYIENHPALLGFDLKVTFEEIAEYLAHAGSDKRQKYRAEFLMTAGTKRLNSWKLEADEATNAFWEAAYQIATKDFQILEMKRRTLTKGSNWITFRPKDMPTMPKYTYVSLRGEVGEVSLTIGNTMAHKLFATISPIISSDMRIHQAGASTAIRIETKAFTVSDGVDVGMPKIREAFDAARRLIEFYRHHQDTIVQAANEATP